MAIRCAGTSPPWNGRTLEYLTLPGRQDPFPSCAADARPFVVNPGEGHEWRLETDLRRLAAFVHPQTLQ
jgi:hypothetical protein